MIHKTPFFFPAYFKNEQKKQKETQKRVGELLKRKAHLETSLTPVEKEKHNRETDSMIQSFYGRSNMPKWSSRVWFHVDMDAFYASVEIRDNPSLIHKPVAVGGMGMISTANYIARTYGVRSAMPGFIGKQLCPELVFVAPSFAKYRYASQITKGIFSQYDPDFLVLSLDEGSLDMTNYLYHKLIERKCLVDGGHVVQGKEEKLVTRRVGMKRDDETDEEKKRGKEEEGEEGFSEEGEKGTMMISDDIVQGAANSSSNGSLEEEGEERGEDLGFEDDDLILNEINSDEEAEDQQEEGDDDDEGGHGGEVEEEGLFLFDELQKEGSSSSSVVAEDSTAVSLSLFSEKEVANVAKEIAAEIQKKVFEATRLTCSVGIGPNRSLAKICADMNKPNGLFSVLPASSEGIQDFLWPLSVRKISGVGKVTESMLAGLGVCKVRDLFLNRYWLRILFSSRSFIHFMEVCHGYPRKNYDSSFQIQRNSKDQKSVSVERTFRPPSFEELLKICQSLCDRLEKDLFRKKVSARVITIKMKMADFKLRQRSLSRPLPIYRSKDLYEAASSLLISEERKNPGQFRLRLLGVRATTLEVFLFFSFSLFLFFLLEFFWIFLK